jgi:hypothetical protein
MSTGYFKNIGSAGGLSSGGKPMPFTPERAFGEPGWTRDLNLAIS